MLCSKYSAVVVILVFCAVSSYAAVFTQPAAKHPDHPGKCYDKITKRPMLPGKEYKPKGICAVMTCNEDASTIDIETCPYIEMPGCEEMPADIKRAYPKCCPQFKCIDVKGQEIIIDLTTS